MYLFKILLLFLFSSQVLANSRVAGIVYERGTRTKLSEIDVFILPHKIKATTKQDGSFEFLDVPEGPFEFFVNSPGYIRLVEKIQSRQDVFTLYLEKETYTEYETTVTGLAEKRDVSRKTLSQKDFLKAPGAQEDPLKAVQNLPGIANQSFSAQVVIQGSEPEDTKYTLNGHEIPIAFHFGGLSSIVMPQIVDSVDYLAAGYGTEFGGVLGGVINLKTRSPKTDRWHGMTFFDLYNAGGFFEGPVSEKSSLFVSYRHAYIGYVLKTVAESMEDSEAFDLTVAPKFSDILLNYEYKLSPSDELSLLAIHSEDELTFVLNEPRGGESSVRGNFKLRTKFFRLIPRWKKKFSDRFDLDLSIAWGQQSNFVSVGNNFFDLNSEQSTLRGELKASFNPIYSAFLGVDAKHEKTELGLELPLSGPNNANPNIDIAAFDLVIRSWEASTYMRNKFSLKNGAFIVSPSIRLTHFSVVDETVFLPHFSTAYKFDSDLILLAAAGLYFQPPDGREYSSVSGNPNLKLEEAKHYLLGIEKDFRGGSSNGIQFSSEVFYKDLSNLVVETSKVSSKGDLLKFSNDGQGRIYGFQTQLKYRLDAWDMVGAYTFLKSKRKKPNEPETVSEFDQTHNLNLIASYELGRWTYASRLRFVTGKPITPIIGATYDGDADKFVPIEGVMFSERVKNFFQLDVRIDRKWVFEKWILSGYLDIQNISNRKNVENVNYSYDYKDKQEVAGLGILPIFGVKGEF